MSNPLRRRRAAAVLSVLLILAACGDDDGDTLTGNVIKDGIGCSITSVERGSDTPEVDLSTAQAQADGDVDAEAQPETEAEEEPEADPEADDDPGAEDETDAEAGAGAEADVEDLVEGAEEACDVSKKQFLTLDMVGVKASDGEEFVNTYGQERPVTAELLRGQLIAGLETGLAEMRVGGRRQITIPPDQAYGADGNPAQGIGPDETLVFVVDLVAVGDVPSYCNENVGIPPAPEGIAGGETKPLEPIEMPVRPFEELSITTITPSEGAEVKEGDDVLFNYLGISCASGQQFDSSWDVGEPLEGTAGGDRLIEGFSKGLIGARVGELRRVDIPADQAYGDDALSFLIQVTEIVPPDADADADADAEADAEAEAGGDADGDAVDGTDTSEPAEGSDEPTTEGG